SRLPLRLCSARSPPSLYPLSLHDALPICPGPNAGSVPTRHPGAAAMLTTLFDASHLPEVVLRTALVYAFLLLALRLASNRVVSIDRKSTRLNSSHQIISYAVFCLKKQQQH